MGGILQYKAASPYTEKLDTLTIETKSRPKIL